MPTTRRQQAVAEGKIEETRQNIRNGGRKKWPAQRHPKAEEGVKGEETAANEEALSGQGLKEGADAATGGVEKRKAEKSNEGPPKKKLKTENEEEEITKDEDDDDGRRSDVYKSGS